MSSSDLPLWDEKYLATLSPEARDKIQIEALRKEYIDRATVASQTESAAFQAAVRLLVAYGRGTYFRYQPWESGTGDRLSCFLAVVPPTTINHDGKLGLALTAIRLSTSGCAYGEALSKIPLADIRKVQAGKGHAEEVASRVAELLPSVRLHALTLATYAEDIGEDSSARVIHGGLVEETSAAGRLRGLYEAYRYDVSEISKWADIRGALRNRPEIRMWGINTTTIDGRVPGPYHLHRSFESNIRTDNPDDFRTQSERELAKIVERSALATEALQLMHDAATLGTPVITLGDQIVNPVPASA
jgi:hypothetical protein